ncbi:MAG: gamma-glutamylcyclotransferase family protein [Terracidiphilus sp.]
MRGVLYDLGGYPGAVADPDAKGKIAGTVMNSRKTKTCWRGSTNMRDSIRRRPQTSEYIRERQIVELKNGNTVECWFYRYNRKPRDEDKVESGAWRK